PRSEPATCAPGAEYSGLRVSTTFVRPGSGRTFGGRDSHCRRPITTASPEVVRRKCFRSSGRCQGRSLSLPITPWRACAQIIPSMTAPSDGDRRLDAGMVLIPGHADVLTGVTEQVIRPAQLQAGELVRVPGQLAPGLLDVVGVDMAVTAGPHELTHVQIALLGDHMRQQRIGGDIERDPQ